MLHTHCGLAAHPFHSRTQVDGTAPIWDIPGLLAEGREKVEDHMMALKHLHGSGCATSIGQSTLRG